MTARTHRYESFTSEAVGALLAQYPLFLPVGSVEQHGPHLPLNVDSEIPNRICSDLASRTGGLVGPTIHYAARSLPHCGGGQDFPGTIHVRGTVFLNYLQDIIASYVASGVRSLFIINGHYENEAFIFEAAERSRELGILQGKRLVALSWWSLVTDELIERLFGDSFPGWHAEHASLCETALLLYLQPEAVLPIRVDNPSPPRAGIYIHPTNGRQISNRGVLGNSTQATPEIGRAIFDQVVGELEALVRTTCQEP